jgi:hypothetical protein
MLPWVRASACSEPIATSAFGACFSASSNRRS